MVRRPRRLGNVTTMSEPASPTTPEAQRTQLAGTVDALAAKLDVRSRAGAKAADLKDSLEDGATTDAVQPRPDLLGVAVIAVGLLVAWSVGRVLPVTPR